MLKSFFLPRLRRQKDFIIEHGAGDNEEKKEKLDRKKVKQHKTPFVLNVLQE